MIYTSRSSTVEPKGVEVTHRNIARLLFGVDYVDLEDCPRILQMALISSFFDASTFEVWGALLHGGCCVLICNECRTMRALAAALHATR